MNTIQDPLKGTNPTETSVSIPAAEPLRIQELPAVKFSRILVPVDFSDNSRQALRFALALARDFNSEITLLHVVHRYPPIPEMAPVDVESLQDARQALNKLHAEFSGLVRSKISLRIGNAASEIAQAARDLGSDLIVISTHGRTGLAHVLMGSTAEMVVRLAPCPVITLRNSAKEFGRG
jgi:nucleotide-binding universal stress UspA family protein